MRAGAARARVTPALFRALGVLISLSLAAACSSSGSSHDASASDSHPSILGASASASPAAQPSAASQAPSASAQAEPGAASSALPSDAATSSATTSSSGAEATPTATATTTPAITVDTKCRKAASSVGAGIAVKGQRPPTFVATTEDCQTLSFASFTDNHPTLVNFFASWCHPCHQEASDLESVYTEWHQKKGFDIVGVETQDESGSPAYFYDTAHYTFPSVWDDGEKIEHAWNTTGAISTLPASFWILPNGTISDVVIGRMTHSQMEDEIAKI